MPANNLVCRYDSTHGFFVTPVKLSAHYVAVHGQPKPAPNLNRYRCNVCGGVYRNPSSHVHAKHPELVAGGRIVGRVVTRLPNGVDGVGGLRGQGVVKSEVVKHDPPAGQSTPRHVGPWSVDDIVLPVVEQLAGPRAVVPVAHLAALLAWRDATAVMLRAVTG